MADPVNKQTRVAETLAEWLEHGDTVPVDALSSPPVTGSAAVALRHPEPAWVLREGAVLLARLGERYGAPEKLVSAWTVEMQMAARRLEDQAEEEARDRLRRQTRWTLRRDRLEHVVAELVQGPASRLARWAAERVGDRWED